MQKISPFLWFNSNAEEAASFYVSIFKDSKIVETMRYGEAGPGPKGEVMMVTFQIEGQQMIALNGGSQFNFTPAISLFVRCQTQAEVEELWDKLSAGGKPIQCGWITDKFGVTWQIVPNNLLNLIRGEGEKSKRAMQAMMKMVKLDIDAVQRAYDGN